MSCGFPRGRSPSRGAGRPRARMTAWLIRVRDSPLPPQTSSTWPSWSPRTTRCIPIPGDAGQRVSFGTSGHRGSAFTATFNEDHILATTQAICEYRAAHGIDGPLYLGADTHALSEPAQVSALEVLAANGVAGPGRRARRVHADPGRVPGHPGPQRGRVRAAGGRDRGHAVAQPAAGRRVQVQPAGRRAGRHRHHQGHPGPGQRAARRRAEGRAPGAVRPGRRGRHHREVRLPGRATCRRCPRWSTCPRSGRPGCGSAPTRWAGPAWPTGARSPSSTTWT